MLCTCVPSGVLTFSYILGRGCPCHQPSKTTEFLRDMCNRQHFSCVVATCWKNWAWTLILLGGDSKLMLPFFNSAPYDFSFSRFVSCPCAGTHMDMKQNEYIWLLSPVSPSCEPSNVGDGLEGSDIGTDSKCLCSKCLWFKHLCSLQCPLCLSSFHISIRILWSSYGPVSNSSDLVEFRWVE